MVDVELDKNKIKILFICWGYSIHAKRRIELFKGDKKFEVGVISNYDYNLDFAKNYLLDGFSKKGVSINNVINKSKKYLKLQNIYLLKIFIFFKKFLEFCLNIFFLKISNKRIIFELPRFLKDKALIKKYISDFKPNIIFLQTLLYPCFLMLDFKLKIPIAIAFWNGDVTWWATNYSFERYFKKFIIKKGMDKADIIFVESKTAEKACFKYSNSIKKMIVTPYPGVDTNIFFPMERSYTKKKLGLEKYRKIILWPRGLGFYLNSDTLIRAAKEVINADKNIYFIILSDVGGEVEYLKHVSISKELGIESNFIWKRQVRYDEMPLYYNSSDIVLSLSNYDSLPNIMLEGMACGIPVIMSNIPQIREVIENDINGILVNPNDYKEVAKKILYLIEDKALVDEFKNRNNIIIKEKYSIEVNKNKIKTLLKSLIT